MLFLLEDIFHGLLPVGIAVVGDIRSIIEIRLVPYKTVSDLKYSDAQAIQRTLDRLTTEISARMTGVCACTHPLW